MLPLTAIWADKTAYAIFDSTTGTMTFKYGEFTPDGVNSWDVSNTPAPSGPFPWELRYDGPLKHVVFDASFAEARPKSCAGWFDACNNLEDIKGLEYLNTSEVTTMDWMFEFCPKLTSLDLSHFNTSNVTSMSNMFAGTTGMETLDLSSFNTSKVTNMTCMFAGSNNENYGGKNQLRTIYVGEGWSTAAVTNGANMFDYCSSLCGGNRTLWSSDHTDYTYARIDVPGTPGYFTSSKMMGVVGFADATVKQICVEHWDTNKDGELSQQEAAAVTSLGEVFKENEEITSFDELAYFTGLTEFSDNEFSNCLNLKSIYIPAGVQSMGGFGFSNCTSLEKIVVDPANTVYDSRNDCNAIIETATKKLIAGCQNTVIPNGVIDIGDDAFWGRWSMETMTIPSTVKKIGLSAFAFCISLKSIEIPASVKVLKKSAFSNSGLTSVVIPATIETLEDGAFQECGDLTEVTFNNPEVSSCCCYGCTSLSTVTLNSVKRIGEKAFEKCPLSNGINLSGVENIGSCAFMSTGIEELTIPASLKETGYETFSWNGTMKKVTFEEGCSYVFDTMFHGNENLSDVTLPSTIKEIQARAFQSCTSLTAINLPEGLEIIGEQAFRLSGLTSIELPEHVASIGNEAFNGSNLTSVAAANTEPVAIAEGVFTSQADAILIVPFGSKALYAEAAGWQDFKQIIEPWAATSTDPIAAGTTVESDDIAMTFGEEGSPEFPVDENPMDGYESIFKYLVKGNGVNGDKAGGTYYLFKPKKNGKLTVAVRQGATKKLYVEESGRVMDDFNGLLPESDGSSDAYKLTYTIPVSANLTYKLYCAGSKLWYYGFFFESSDEVANISFADEKVKALCVKNWDTNKDGELSQQEAAAVTSLEDVFKENGEITSFDELRYFTRLNSIDGWVTFLYCRALKSITIPSGVTHIDGAAFAGCEVLESISVDPANTVYDSRQRCNSVIETATGKLIVGSYDGSIHQSVTAIGVDAFHGRPSVGWVSLPESVTAIEEGAFAWSGIWYVQLPEGLKEIGSCAFEGCYNLSEVVALNAVPLVLKDAETFSDRANITLRVPNKSIDMYKEAPVWGEFKQIVGLYSNQIYADKATLNPGYDSQLVINLENEEAYTAFQFDLVLPEGITLEKDENGKYIVTKSDRYPASRSITVTPHEGNMYRIVSASLKNEAISGNTGTLLTLSLTADETIEEREYTGEIKNTILTKANESQFNADPATVYINVHQVLLGDANNDGQLNITDVVASINNILGRASVAFNKLQADINRDGVVDIFDVVLNLNIIGSQAVRQQRASTRAAEGEATALPKLSINNCGVSATEPTQAQIELDNEAAYLGFQFDLLLPEGVTLTGYSADTKRLPADFAVEMEQVDGIYRFIGAGMSLEPITGTSGSIISLTLEASDDIKGRDLSGKLKDIKLSEINGTGATMQETTFAITNLSAGDLDGNGTLDAADVSEMAALIMAGTYKAKADINADDKVDASDLVLLISLTK